MDKHGVEKQTVLKCKVKKGNKEDYKGDSYGNYLKKSNRVRYSDYEKKQQKSDANENFKENNERDKDKNGFVVYTAKEYISIVAGLIIPVLVCCIVMSALINAKKRSQQKPPILVKPEPTVTENQYEQIEIQPSEEVSNNTEEVDTQSSEEVSINLEDIDIQPSEEANIYSEEENKSDEYVDSKIEELESTEKVSLEDKMVGGLDKILDKIKERIKSDFDIDWSKLLIDKDGE